MLRNWSEMLTTRNRDWSMRLGREEKRFRSKYKKLMNTLNKSMIKESFFKNKEFEIWRMKIEFLNCKT